MCLLRFHFRFLTIVGKLGSLVIGVGVGKGIADFPLPSGWVPFFIIVSGILILHIQGQRERER